MSALTGTGRDYVMRIGLIVCVDDEIEKSQMFGIRYMPVWAYTLASYIRKIPNVEIFLYDTRHQDRAKTPEADIFLISGINQDFSAIISYERTLRKLHPKAKLILGGPIVSSYKLVGKIESLFAFDHLFMGDAENAVTAFIQDLILKKPLGKIINNASKFALSEAIPIDFELLKKNKEHYYGGVIEVSRGCPFLCEFCDIRTKPNNNTTNNKSIDVILEELEQYSALGIRDILFACDNFIGDHVWAEMVCDKIIEWRKNNNVELHIYTWLTINLAYFPRLMKKMKLAGFDMFFIGVESFGLAQLLETAKVQNTKTDITESIKTIQSHGFIIVAGLIFGFDTDPEDAVQVALDGIKNSGVISGDPSLLTALPGTPLFSRIKHSGRLREGKIGLGGKKYATNILYLRDKDKMISDFIYFTTEFNRPSYQYSRYSVFISTVIPGPKNMKGASGYINVLQLWKMIKRNPDAIFSFAKRVFSVINTPAKIFYTAKALILTIKMPQAKMTYFYFWLFNWSNSVLKYGNLKSKDFDIESVNKSYELKNIIPPSYETDFFEPIPKNKIKAQRFATISSLKKLIADGKS
ncbi:MAG: radical SAM protein [Bacteriovorax sp.]|jgi:radical SAM superfamily enzyme YgiQ (UPF0313 family)